MRNYCSKQSLIDFLSSYPESSEKMIQTLAYMISVFIPKKGTMLVESGNNQHEFYLVNKSNLRSKKTTLKKEKVFSKFWYAKTLLFFLLVILSIGSSNLVFSQEPFEPSIVILSPYKTFSEKQYKHEIKEYNQNFKSNHTSSLAEARRSLDGIENRPANIQEMIKKKIAFIEEGLNFYSSLQLNAEGFLQYLFYNRFPNLLIYSIHKSSSGKIEELSSIASEHNMQYVLNFPEVKTYNDHGETKSMIKVQLFDNSQQKVILEKEYTGNTVNPGFEFTCDEGTLLCTFSNAQSIALYDILETIAANSPSVIREREISEQRDKKLFEVYYKNKFPILNIPEVISEYDSSILTSGYYYGLTDESNQKFISFFVYDKSEMDFSSLQNNGDHNVNIITNDLQDLDNIPSIYAYIVIGVQSKGKWYLKKENVTYFESESIELAKQKYFSNLKKWNFFKEDSSSFNPEFWETYFFEKVSSSLEKNQDEIEELRMLQKNSSEESEKKMYQIMIDRYYEDDAKNEPYFGMYEIVASEIKDQERIKNELYEDSLTQSLILPFFDDYVNSSEGRIDSYQKLNSRSFTIIYPKAKDMFLCPIVFKYSDKEPELHYFVFIKNNNKSMSPYKWNFFTPVTPRYNSAYGSDINDQLNTITKWNFSFDYLNDSDFWNNYILQKENGSFKYLEKVQD